MRALTNRFPGTIKGKKEPGFQEIFALLNFDESPAALVDTETRSILFINSRLIKLAYYSQPDVIHKDVNFLLPGLDLDTAYSGEMRQLKLDRKNLTPIDTRVRFDYIDAAGKWLILRFLPGVIDDTERKIQLETTYRRLTDFIQLSDSPDLTLKVLQGVDIIRQILDCGAVCLYQADPEHPQLSRIAEAGEVRQFPEILPSTDLIRLDKPSIWVTGNRILTELHRTGKVSGFEYVASAPLFQGGGAFGLLVAAGQGGIPINLSLAGMELLSALLLSTFQQQMLVDNLNEKIENSIKVVQLRNQAFDYMNEAVLILDEKMEIVEINPAAEYMLGYANWETVGQSYENILIGTDRLLPALNDALKGQATFNIGKASLNRRNGQSFPVEVKVIPVVSGESVTGMEILITDISEHEESKAVTQQLEHRAVLGDYTAAFAHDVRNPINNISTGLQLLSASLDDKDPSQDVISKMLGDCTRLNHLMESFLAFSRPLEMKFEAIEVESFLKRIIDRWQPRMARVNVKSILNVNKDVMRITGDPRSLENVFTNLISNALEAMTETGDTLAIKVGMVKEINGHPHVEISVSDNGPGIPEDVKERIFEPFVTTRKMGTGLGLAITKQIVNAHKGSIKVDSFPGGTVFTVQLPAERNDA
jgi:PAS domain S-box-containing protein